MMTKKKSFNSKLPYTHTQRLADVMALIQVLSLADYRHRSNSGLIKDLQGSPKSDETWENIAKEHPEFFRVENGAEKGLNISLISRHAIRKREGEKRELTSDYISMLLVTAINLHDRQIKRASWWKVFMPLVGVVVGGVITILAAWIINSP